MSPASIALIVVASIFTNCVVAGSTWALLIRDVSPEDRWDHPGFLFGAVFWPLTLPVWVGVRVTQRLTRRTVDLPKATARRSS